MESGVVLKRYRTEYCDQTAELFYETVHTVNAKDYSEEQLNVWADGKTDLEKWNKSLLEHYSIVAIKDGQLVGFGDIDETGYLDRLFVHKDFQHQGIASAICTLLEDNCNAKTISTCASITARPFFEKRGYKVIKKQQVQRKGIFLTNFVMEKSKQIL